VSPTAPTCTGPSRVRACPGVRSTASLSAAANASSLPGAGGGRDVDVVRAGLRGRHRRLRGLPVGPEVQGAGPERGRAVGDLDEDDRPDLVVGARGAASLSACYGTAKELGGCTQLTGGEVSDQSYSISGTSVVLGDLDRDGYDDLVVGAPGEDTYDGAVTLLEGKGDAFTTRHARTVTLEDLGFAAPRDATFGDVLGR